MTLSNEEIYFRRVRISKKSSRNLSLVLIMDVIDLQPHNSVIPVSKVPHYPIYTSLNIDGVTFKVLETVGLVILKGAHQTGNTDIFIILRFWSVCFSSQLNLKSILNLPHSHNLFHPRNAFCLIWQIPPPSLSRYNSTSASDALETKHWPIVVYRKTKQNS